MQLYSKRIRHGACLIPALAFAAACTSESTGIPPMLSVRNDTGDTLIVRAVEKQTAFGFPWIGIVDTATAIQATATPPNFTFTFPRSQVWGYAPGADIRFDVARVSGSRLSPAGYFIRTNAELSTSSFFVSIRPSDLAP